METTQGAPTGVHHENDSEDPSEGHQKDQHVEYRGGAVREQEASEINGENGVHLHGKSYAEPDSILGVSGTTGSDLDDETMSVASSTSMLSLSRTGLRLAKGASKSRSADANAAVISRLKGEIAILRDSLDKLNATDVAALSDKLRGCQADCRTLKQKNVELKNRIMSLEDSLFKANAQLQQAVNAGTPRARHLPKTRGEFSDHADSELLNVNNNHEQVVSKLKLRLQSLASEIVTLMVTNHFFSILY
jgi:hypothetical protein